MNAKKLTFLVVILGLTAVALRAMVRHYQMGQVHSLIVVYAYSVFEPPESAQPKYTNYETRAVRSDGAVMTANSVVDAHGQIRTSRALSFADRYVVADPVSESKSTYKPVRLVVKPTQSCGGQPGTPILGYRTEHVVRDAFSKDMTIHHHHDKLLAPDLDCLPVHEEFLEVEDKARVVREAVQIIPGEPPASMFDVPATYQERSPGEVLNETAKRLGWQTYKPMNDKVEQSYHSQKLK